jgi:hypothetical protein
MNHMRISIGIVVLLGCTAANGSSALAAEPSAMVEATGGDVVATVGLERPSIRLLTLRLCAPAVGHHIDLPPAPPATRTMRSRGTAPHSPALHDQCPITPAKTNRQTAA